MSAKTNSRLPGALNLERQQKHILKVIHVATGFSVEFPAFLDAFSDAYTSNWHQQEAYGRMDSIANFSSTRRNISLAWNVPAESYEHAQENLEKLNMLIQFLYPLYDTTKKDADPVINMDPYWRLSFGNLARDAKTGQGLLGYVNGLTFDPELEYGMFKDKPHMKAGSTFQGAGSSQQRQRSLKKGVSIHSGNPQNNGYYPKSFRLNMEFKVLHEHSLGFGISAPERALNPNRTVKFAGKKDDQRARARFSFNDPSLGFEKFPYRTPDSTGADSWRKWDAGVKTIPRSPRAQPDPQVPAKAIQTHTLKGRPVGDLWIAQQVAPDAPRWSFSQRRAWHAANPDQTLRESFNQETKEWEYGAK